MDSSQSDQDNDDIEPESIDHKLLWAAKKGFCEMVDKILEKNIDIIQFHDEDGYTALHKASSEGHLEVVKSLLSFRADVKARTADGWTPLHCASKWNNADVAKILLDNGAEINALSHGGLSPLHIAANSNTTRDVLIVLLTNSSIDISLKTNAGDTALDLAQRSGTNASLFQLAASHILTF